MPGAFEQRPGYRVKADRGRCRMRRTPRPRSMYLQVQEKHRNV